MDLDLAEFLASRECESEWCPEDEAPASCHVPQKKSEAAAPLASPRDGDMVLVTGNTYPVKDALRMLGGRWDSVEKGWRVPVERFGEARALVASAGAKRPRATGDGRCQKCGRACKPQFATCFGCSGRASKYNASRRPSVTDAARRAAALADDSF